ncbi:MAG: aminotransferase class III-fold pyridoxal phosphate-dependent enzyme [Planctomycetaceae bacterium]|nr:aminotransferase class III-fold pyridoxal phosphate-dependent enzyme [Planctomycetaceae bacterium]
MFSKPPQYSLDQLTRWVEDHFRLSDLNLKPLPSERDAVFCVLVARSAKYILKVSNPDESWDFLEAQNGMLDRVSELTPQSCRVVPNRFGKRISQWVDWEGRACAVRLLSFVAGEVLANVVYRSPKLLEEIGLYLGRLDSAVSDYHHPALVRTLPWDLQQGRQLVQQLAHHVDSAELRQQLELCLRIYDSQVAPVAEDLPRSVIHNDANDHNILVQVSNDVSQDCVSGLIDFGDAVETWTISELAIALAYLLLDANDPWSMIVPVVRGYHRQRSLSEIELQALFPLVLLRLCTSVVMAAEGISRDPNNAYLQISQQPVQRTLPRLLEIAPQLAEAVVRDACGFSPLARSAAWTQWLATERGQFHFPLGLKSNATGCRLDLSSESELLATMNWPIQEAPLTDVITATIKEQGADYGIGHYFEPRSLYQSEHFGVSQPPAQRRTIHLGIDLFAEAGVPVLAVADGSVHAVARIDLPLDYGTLVVLRHEWPGGSPFFTLYGHLAKYAKSEEDCNANRPLAPKLGAKVAAGQCLGILGNPSENGGWPPHLHFQVLMDDLGDAIRFPGVGQAELSRVWAALSPNPQWLLDLPALRSPEHEQPTTDLCGAREALRSQRLQRIGRSVRLSYETPLHLVRGAGVYLFDSFGRQYLDAYNNVPHVGHSHPEVIETAQKQWRLLNTNTRYLHQNAIRFAKNLTRTLPPSLEVCFFLSSASEANELALRLARSYVANQHKLDQRTRATPPRDVIVMETAYHGHTTGLIDCSPYKHAGPGGVGRPDWVHVVELPDVYRGKHRGADAGARYAAEVAETIVKIGQEGKQLTAWMAETCPSVGGQVILPHDYLAEVYRAVRAAGGVCIADEVQTGYGRMGTAFYAFEMHNVVPDVVVLGKPIGNGYPLAAVVTTRAIADAFDNGMEFFSTFGGSTVSCAVGDCVLNITLREKLPEHAANVGRFLQREFERLQRQFEWIGDVRGSGLFWGLDIVKSPETREADPNRAGFIKQRLCDQGILIGTDGIANNVLKIRPPLPFNIAHAEQLINGLAEACRATRASVGSCSSMSDGLNG